MTRKSKQVQNETRSFKEFLESLLQNPNFLALVDDPGSNPSVQKEILQNAPSSSGSIGWNDWASFVHQSLTLTENNPPVHNSFQILNKYLQLEKQSIKATHLDKRSLVYRLGMKQELHEVSLIELINSSSSFEEAAIKVQSVFNAQLELCVRRYSAKDLSSHPGAEPHNIKSHQHLVEVGEPGTAKTILCNSMEGYRVVQANESVIFVSRSPSGGYKIELCVLRNIPDLMENTSKLMDWLKNIIDEACTNRRNVRPAHKGTMIQIGLNNGPRHARILGWAKSFTRKLSPDKMISQDEDLIGAMSLMWSLVKGHLPCDITEPAQKAIDEGYYPTLRTCNVGSGEDFSIQIDGVKYTFPTSGRAPPEAIASRGYEAPSHTDQSALAWAFAWTVARDLSITNELPYPEMGSAFVDLGIKVTVHSAACTLTAFQPQEMHGTTSCGGVVTYSLIMSSTQRVEDALKKWKADGEVNSVAKYLAGIPVSETI